MVSFSTDIHNKQVIIVSLSSMMRSLGMGAIVLVITLVYAEIASMIPRSGLITRYGHYSHGGIAGLFFGWAYWI